MSSFTCYLCRHKCLVQDICSSGVHARGYVQEFSLILDKKLWPEWYEIWLRPNPTMRRKATGRLVSTRFRNEMDEAKRQEKQCGLCKQTGHTRRGYPIKPQRIPSSVVTVEVYRLH
ncbi:hypothetical protein Ahy_B10g100690 [Arachis hypogaea]|uniref:Uncharacterized protein n=1 Tax=Arachis hypogaea TaxID=3818 RepID=A0A444WXL7_ARAHY|nr:hypothetical protein Ahy_B10g100690 [Arachis hypogaea]